MFQMVVNMEWREDNSFEPTRLHVPRGVQLMILLHSKMLPQASNAIDKSEGGDRRQDPEQENIQPRVRKNHHRGDTRGKKEQAKPLCCSDCPPVTFARHESRPRRPPPNEAHYIGSTETEYILGEHP